MVDEKSMLSLRTKALRERRGWTIAETARRAELSTSMLWKVENGQTTLTYGKLMKLAAGLEVPIGELFSPAEETVRKGGRRVVNRQGSSPMVDFADNMHHFLATDIASKDFCPCLVEVDAIDGESLGHPGEEFIFVIKGRVKFLCEGYSPVVLDVGDSVYFDATLAHRYLREGTDPAQILCIYSHSDVEGEERQRGERSSLPRPIREGMAAVGTAKRLTKAVAPKTRRSTARKRISA